MSGVVLIKAMFPDARMPTAQTPDAVGYDLYAYIRHQQQYRDQDEIFYRESEELKLWPRRVVPVPCGFQMALPSHMEAQIRSRSGMARKGIIIPNSPGTIDPDYRGGVAVLLMNLGEEVQTVRHGDRIAQMVFGSVIRPTLTAASELPSTVRGEGGFGSTGV